MIRYLLPAILLLSACQAETTCEPCTQQHLDEMTLAERTALAIASGDEDAIPRAPKSYADIMQGLPFCETLETLSAEGIRRHLTDSDLPVSTETGMISLAMCQLYYRDQDAGLLTLYRLMEYLDLKESQTGTNAELQYFKRAAGKLLFENGPVSLDFYTGSQSFFANAEEPERRSSADNFDASGRDLVDEFWSKDSQAQWRAVDE